jgi:porphobilinogen synthase
VQGADFPQARPRRLRRNAALRAAAADVQPARADLICPLFVHAGEETRDVPSMPGVQQLSVRQTVERMEELTKAGVFQFILFGVTPAERKEETGAYAAAPDAPVNRALQEAREAGLEAVLYADLCFCEYTDHGHCGVLSGDEATVDNDRTLERLAAAAVAQARAGADVVAPSGMMDGQVKTIRAALDEAGFSRTAILAYTAKYASNLYGPFRDAGEGGMAFGDRQGYQMDFRRRDEWRTELALDLREGADMIMVKPATAYMDVLKGMAEVCSLPVGAYHVSGEYAMLCAAAEQGLVELEPAALELLTGLKRAGADLILTYLAPWIAEALEA